MFASFYKKVLSWSKGKYATSYLSAVSFTESFIFPIPPDVLLIPMCLARPQNSLYFAFITTFYSVLGGFIGYIIGLFLYESFSSQILTFIDESNIYLVNSYIEKWGFIAVLISGFTPLPYKAFTIASGLGGVSLFQFIIASIIGRGFRFYLIAIIIKIFGSTIEKKISKYVEYFGWFILIIILILFISNITRT